MVYDHYLIRGPRTQIQFSFFCSNAKRVCRTVEREGQVYHLSVDFHLGGRSKIEPGDRQDLRGVVCRGYGGRRHYRWAHVVGHECKVLVEIDAIAGHTVAGNVSGSDYDREIAVGSGWNRISRQNDGLDVVLTVWFSPWH